MFHHLTEYSFVFVTTNGVVKRNGELVMGAGAAKRLALMFPEVPKIFGESIKKNEGYRENGEYRLITPFTKEIEGKKIQFGGFQVKYGWYDSAKLNLIEFSTKALFNFALDLYNNDESVRIALNYPGIGNGKLKEYQVEPIIKTLPDWVDVWKY